MSEVLERRQEGATCILTLNRPEVFNCISSPLMQAMIDAFDAIEPDRSVRAVVIAARGKHFCTGADLKEAGETRQDPERHAAFTARAHRMMDRIEQSRLPVIAAVQGLALAGGLELAMVCDVVFAGRAQARFGDQHARYGLVPGWGGSQRLVRLVGRRRALDLMFSARWIDAEEARDWGLATHVVDDAALLGEALAYAGDLARRNPDGLAAMKALAHAAEDEPLAAGLARERQFTVWEVNRENVAEGLAAFREKREPVFR